MPSDLLTQRIVKKVLRRIERSQKPIIANVSNRHVHLSEDDLNKFFGFGYKYIN